MESLTWTRDEISFTEIIAVLGWHQKAILRVAIIAGLVGTVAAFVIPAKYTAEAVIMTPQQTSPSMSALAQLSGGNSALGLSSLSLLAGFGLRNASDLYVGILQSRSIADALIKKYDLKKVYRDRDLYATRKDLARNTSIKAGKDTLIHVRVSDRNPRRAEQLANSYVEELALQNSTVSLNEATQRRSFFEQQLVREKEALADAEVALRNTQQVTGLIVPGGQAEALLRSISQLHAEILNRQAQIEGLKTYVTEENPRLQMARRQLSTLETELANLERGERTADRAEVPVGQLPEAGLAYIRRYRDVKYHELLYEALARQFEAAKLDEAKAGAPIQIIDQAVMPERRSWPPRTVIIIGSILLGLIFYCFQILLRHNSQVRFRQG